MKTTSITYLLILTLSTLILFACNNTKTKNRNATQTNTMLDSITLLPYRLLDSISYPKWGEYLELKETLHFIDDIKLTYSKDSVYKDSDSIKTPSNVLIKNQSFVKLQGISEILKENAVSLKDNLIPTVFADKPSISSRIKTLLTYSSKLNYKLNNSRITYSEVQLCLDNVYLAFQALSNEISRLNIKKTKNIQIETLAKIDSLANAN